MDTKENISFKINGQDETDDFDKTSVLSEEEYQEEMEKEYSDDEQDNKDRTETQEDNDNSEDDDGDYEEEEEDEQISIKKKETSIKQSTNLSILQDDDSYESEETDDESDDEYITKFDNDIKKDHIIQHHPEIIQSNYDEITALCKVIRDKNGSVIDPIHKTIPILTKYEKTRVLGLRTKQLNSGSEPFVKVPDNIVEGYLIAQMELEAKSIPFIIARPLPGGKKEYWHLKDLENVDY